MDNSQERELRAALKTFVNYETSCSFGENLEGFSACRAPLSNDCASLTQAARVILDFIERGDPAEAPKIDLTRYFKRKT